MMLASYHFDRNGYVVEPRKTLTVIGPIPPLELELQAERRSDWNEVNPGLGLTFFPGRHLGYTAGVFKNSYNDTSMFAGITGRVPFRLGELGMSGGAVSGYDELSDAPVLPLLVPYARINVARKYALRLNYLPPIGKFTTGVIGAELVIGLRR
jgi:hypothetical protein